MAFVEFALENVLTVEKSLVLERQAGNFNNMTNYPLGDFLIQIKNAGMAGRKEVTLKTSKLINAVSKVLKKENILDSVSEKDGMLTVTLAQHNKEAVLLDLKLISKPGLRKYMNVDDLKTRRRRGASFIILSTPKGIKTSDDCIKEKTGGEALAEIW